MSVSLIFTLSNNKDHIHTPSDAVIENKAEATCTAQGHYDSVIYCSDCESLIQRTAHVIEILDHKYGDWFVYEEPQVNNIGLLAHSCSECDYKAYHKLENLNTSNYMYTVTNPATCVTTGIGTYSIEKDNQTFSWDVILPLEKHSFDGLACTVCNIEYSSVGLTYTLSDDGESYSVTGADSFDGEFVMIPETYNGLPVTAIGYRAFASFTSVKRFIIPDNVTSIGKEAFSGCSSIESITIPDSVASIGISAFSDCTALEEICFNATAVNDLGIYAFENAGHNGDGINVTIGKNVTKIPPNLFYQNGNVEASPKIISVTFEEGSVCESIGSQSFYGCDGFTSITIPDSVTSIDHFAFVNCLSLTSITVPKNVTSLGAGVFLGCKSLTEIYFNATSLDNSNHQGSFTDAGWDGDGIKVVIGKDVTKIPANLFALDSDNGDYAPKIVSVEFEEGSVCESIGKYAFFHCESLISITIPSSVKSIGASAFSNCSSLTSVVFENPNGWRYNLGGNRPSQYFSSSELSDFGKAATYLSSTYDFYYWYRD